MMPTPGLGRSPRACSNCRRRKMKCNGARSGCNQCRSRPPRSGAPCVFDRDTRHAEPNAAQMQKTIMLLKSRVHELEQASAPLGSPAMVQHAYSDLECSPPVGNSPPSEEPIPVQEPPSEIIEKLVNTFLDRFAHTCYFFLDPLQFLASAFPAPPFNALDRPSQALLNAVYLWGSILLSHRTTPTTSPLPYPYAEQNYFLLYALQSLPDDIRLFPLHPNLVLQTIQAHLLLSLYYMHAALPVEGRYHSAAAVSLAFSAGLNHAVAAAAGSLANANAALGFPLAAESVCVLPPAMDAREEAERVNAFWAVVINENCWVAAEGTPSAIRACGAAIDTPWPSSGSQGQGGSTVIEFLNNDDDYAGGRAPMALLAKASVLLERAVAFSGSGHVHTHPARTALAHSLHTFHASLPLPSSGGHGHTLFLAHALTDLALIRLHAPFTSTSERARYTALSAARRLAARMEALSREPDTRVLLHPVLGPICATACALYLREMAELRMHQWGWGWGSVYCVQYRELEAQAAGLMGAMGALARGSPVMQHCLVSTRRAYGARAWSDISFRDAEEVETVEFPEKK
ncbi:hypothetical protein B0H11DRAFT_2347731 [Mycena galericulata]|nr:hypothetical protein B0H11DRAFT_2347731 [Mycena galericulata]